MNVFAWVLLAALVVAAGATCWSHVRHRPDVQRLSRPAFRVLLIALAWLLQADTVDYGRLLLLALLLGLAADWLRYGRFEQSPLGERAGWAALLLARLAYLAAIVLMPESGGPLWLAVGLLAFLLAWAGRLALVPAARGQWRAGAPLFAYALVVAAVPAAAWSSASVGLGWGATALFAGDVLLGYERFRRPLPRAPLTVEVLHDLGEVLIVLGMLRG